MDVVDIGKGKVKKKPGRPKGTSAFEPPLPPTWQQPSSFPADSASILQKKRISKKQFNRYVEQLSMFLLTNFSADFAISLQNLIRNGDKVGMEMFAKTIGLLKNDSPVTVNLQNNLQISQGIDRDKSFDNIVRMLDERDRKENAITVAPERVLIESPKTLSGSGQEDYVDS